VEDGLALEVYRRFLAGDNDSVMNVVSSGYDVTCKIDDVTDVNFLYIFV
jgi:hypothetical protein